MPRHEGGIGPRLNWFAHCVRVEYELQNVNGLTISFGIRGGSQSVVKRMESCHFFISAIVSRFRFFRRTRVARLATASFRLSNHCKSSRASLGESFFTFEMARSTALTPSM